MLGGVAKADGDQQGTHLVAVESGESSDRRVCVYTLTAPLIEYGILKCRLCAVFTPRS